ncbi:MAG: InlB B-repeat-containing protein [Bacilli bacterium]|nr:InlB B-repeat-containing protein [Bacilli bacterium]MDD4389062.1 InlB B-repeat-containing protein [Bacilli bacterium]
MKKLTRKIFISLFTAVFALITLGATTFAWFTLTTTVEVQEFEAEITSGTGIEVSLDGVKFTSYIRTDEIVAKIKSNLSIGEGDIVLDAVTTPTGYDNFKTIDITTVPGQPQSKEATGGWIYFDLYFRTPYQEDNQDTWVYLLTGTSISSNGKMWQSDANFEDANSFNISSGDTKTVYACNSLRMSFLTHDFQSGKIGQANSIGNATTDVVIYELTPTFNTAPAARDDNQRLDYTLKTYGSIDYFRVKTGGTSGINLFKYYNDSVLPRKVLNSSHLVSSSSLENVMEAKEAVVKLNAFDESKKDYYYGVVKARMWIEGWDPDCYNAIMAADLKIKLSFGGSGQAPDPVAESPIDTTEYNITYTFETGQDTATHANPATFTMSDLALFLEDATLSGFVFDGWYLDATYETPITFIPADRKEAITIYGKFIVE